MAYYLQVNGKDLDQIATTTGWGDYGRWAATLPPRRFLQVRRLYSQGFSEAPIELFTQLDEALVKYPPTNDLRIIIQEILKLLKRRKNSATLVGVTNGMR